MMISRGLLRPLVTGVALVAIGMGAGMGLMLGGEDPASVAIAAPGDPIITLPPGSVTPYSGGSTPAGFLPADGTAVSRTTYAALFAVIGTTYGAGDGSSTFNVPDLRGRVPIGSGTGAQNGGAGTGAITGGTALTSRSRGQFGGDERLQSHTHPFSGTTGTENNYSSYGVGYLIGARERSIASAGQGWGVWSSFDGYSHTHPFSGTTSGHNQSQGSGANMPPYTVTSFIIKT